MALVITRDGGVPVISHAYPGDRPDVTQFPTVIDELVARYRDLVTGVESLTVVYDAGQNSGDNHAVVEAHGIGFVGSLPPSDHPDLLGIPDRDYRPVDADRYPGLRYVDTTVTALGVTRRAVLTHSANLAAKQSRGLDQTLAKARRRLAELAARLARGRTRRDREKVQAEITTICKPRWVADILTVTLTGDTPAELRLSWRTDTKARKRLESGCSANGSCSPTATGRCPTWWPPTDPNPTPSSASANSKTHTWSRSARCTTGPTPRSGCTCSTACSPWPSPT